MKTTADMRIGICTVDMEWDEAWAWEDGGMIRRFE